MPPLTEANHRIRAENVTASEVGALLGEHPYMTAGQIWDRLMGIAVPKPTSDAMAFGSAAEPILRRMACDALGATVRLNGATYRHRRVRLAATPDAMVIAVPGALSGVELRDLVEFKLSFSHDRWRNGLPPDIEWQARAQMACARRNAVWVYVFHGKAEIYHVVRHVGKERRLTQAVERFWTDHIETGIRPADVVKPVSFEWRG